MQCTQLSQSWGGQLLVPRCSLLTQPLRQHQASHVRGFSFHFLSPLLLSRAIIMLTPAPQEENWDFIAFCSLSIAPGVQQPPGP